MVVSKAAEALTVIPKIVRREEARQRVMTGKWKKLERLCATMYFGLESDHCPVVFAVLSFCLTTL